MSDQRKQQQHVYKQPAEQHDDGDQQGNSAQRVQKWWRGVLSRKGTRKLLKMMRVRRKVVEELVQTELNYIEDLRTIWVDIRGGLLRTNAVTQEDARIIFSNVNTLQLLNEMFFTQIFDKVRNYSHWGVIFQSAERNISFFKMYFQYIRNYQTAQGKLNSLSGSRNWAVFEKQMQRDPRYRKLGVVDYLIKPVHRLPKYVLLLKQLRKNTPLQHKDLPNIKALLKQFQKINESNDGSLNKVLNQRRLAELQREVGSQFLQPYTELVAQEAVGVLVGRAVVDATLYLLNCQAMVVHRGKNGSVLVSRVPFRHGASISDHPLQFYFRNTFTLHSQQGDSCTFICTSQQEKSSLLRLIYSQLITRQHHIHAYTRGDPRMRKMLELMPDVTVLGTEERIALLTKYTVYIVEVRIRSIRFRVFLRYSEILDIQGFVGGAFPTLELKQRVVKSNWLFNHRPAIIEERKMSVERFLRELLSKPTIIESGQELLVRLNLPYNFYSLVQSQDLKKSSLSQRSTNSTLKKTDTRRPQSLFDNHSNEGSDESRKIFMEDVLKLIQGHCYVHPTQQESEQNGANQLIKIQVMVPNLTAKQGLLIIQRTFGKNQRVAHGVTSIAMTLGLKHYRDFRLFVQKGYFSRQLHRDQLLYKIKEQSLASACKLYFKKGIFLHSYIEQVQQNGDAVRRSILAAQLMDDAKRGRIRVTQEQLIKLSALTGLLLLRDSNADNVLLRAKRLSLNEQSWLECGEYIWGQHVREQMRRRAHSQNSSSSNVQILCPQMQIISMLKEKQQYGANQYLVRVVQSEELDAEEGCWLLVKYDSVGLMSLDKHRLIFQSRIRDILRIETFSNSISLHLRQIKQIKVLTECGFAIKENIMYFKNYGAIIDKLSTKFLGDSMLERLREQET